MTFAATTEVPVERTRAEIERVVSRYGATRFASGWEEGAASVLFEMKDRRVRFRLPLPQAQDRKFTHDGRGMRRSVDGARRAHDQALRARWRALLLVIKAKLEAVESGVETFEQAFMPHIVTPGGFTLGERIIPELEAIYRGSPMPPLLGPGA